MRSQARSPTGLNRPLLVLLGTATTLASIAACALAQDQVFPAAAFILLLALVYGQTSLLALFLGLGTAHWFVRFVALTAGIAVWVFALGRTIHAPHDYVATYLVLQAGAVALLADVGRRAGIHWSTTVPADDSARGRACSRRQFTLVQLLGWTTLAAILAALGRRATFPGGAVGVHQALSLIANVLVGLTAAWAASTADHHLRRLAVLVAAAAGLGLATNTLFPSRHDRGPDVAFYVLQALFVAAWIGAGRVAGLRIGRDDVG